VLTRVLLTVHVLVVVLLGTAPALLARTLRALLQQLPDDVHQRLPHAQRLPDGVVARGGRAAAAAAAAAGSAAASAGSAGEEHLLLLWEPRSASAAWGVLVPSSALLLTPDSRLSRHRGVRSGDVVV
jgi:hypothetical protein